MRVIIDNHERFEGLRAIILPPALREIYGGDIDLLPEPLDTPFTYLSFVVSKEGIFGLKNAPGFAPISQGNHADAFMLALLHAFPDAVMIGAGTLRGEPNMEWHLGHLFKVIPQLKDSPDLLRAFVDFRASLGKRDEYPPTFFVTNSGDINFKADVFRNSAVKKYIVTGKKGAGRIVSTGVNLAPLATEVLPFGEEVLDQKEMMKFLRSELGIKTLFHEGGRQVADAALREGLAQQLFLTRMATSPTAEFGPDDAQYLFSAPSHQLPDEAKIISEREDKTRAARLFNIDIHMLSSF